MNQRTLFVCLLALSVLSGCQNSPPAQPSATQSATKASGTKKNLKPKNDGKVAAGKAESKAAPKKAPEEQAKKTEQAAPATKVAHPKVKAFGDKARSIMAAIASGGTPADIAKKAEELTQLGAQVLPEFIKKHPECTAYLNAVLAATPSLKAMTLEVIERDYHNDGKLPKSPATKCYHAKDLVVHPATVVVLSGLGLGDQAQRDKATAEIAEVLAHLGDVDKHL